MTNFFDAIVFDKGKIIKIGQKKKLISFFYVIGLSLMTSLIIILLKTTYFDYHQFNQNVLQLEESTAEVLVYKDTVNSILIKEEQLVFNGENMASIRSLKDLLAVESYQELGELLKESKQQIIFVMFLYQYLVSMTYLIIFCILLFLLSQIGKRQVKIVDDISNEQSLTYTSYNLTIPILASMLLRLLNFRFNFSIVIIIGLSVGLQFLFMKYYIKEKVDENERKEMVA